MLGQVESCAVDALTDISAIHSKQSSAGISSTTLKIGYVSY